MPYTAPRPTLIILMPEPGAWQGDLHRIFPFFRFFKNRLVRSLDIRYNIQMAGKHGNQVSNRTG
jgi:hypothetical protein